MGVSLDTRKRVAKASSEHHEIRRKETVRALTAELLKLATEEELEEIKPQSQEVQTMADDNTKTARSRSTRAVKLGLAQFGVERVSRGATAIAKQPFEPGTKIREFLETDEGRMALTGVLALLANFAAESEKFPLDPDNIEWVTEAAIANTVRDFADIGADASMEKMLATGMQLWQFALALRQPESMADIIDMTQRALDVENTVLDSSVEEEDAAKATKKAKA